ncbi:MAG: hypothetical protein ACI4XF_01740, partial [Oscillospiraceae bacterium]
GREEREEQTMPYIETIPPRSVTSPTFTGSTAEYYTAESTRAPMTGATGLYGTEDIYADTPDRNGAYEAISADTAADIGSPERVQPDTAMGTEAFITETADTYR